MPEAGAGGTSGAVLGSCRGGKAVNWPRCGGARVCEWTLLECTVLAVRDGVGPGVGLPAIADVDRNAIGRRESLSRASALVGADSASVACLPGGMDGGGFGARDEVLVDERGVLGGLDELWRDAWEADWERCRMDNSEGFRLRSWLLVDR
ncbi:uncharacterized protein VDAG_06096 [Verticillium dahliae VdLs.17]|uniref:Uncharacterized protein n=1 Tax=Verticillium dahliae (strain VdLs.17 / ATCC MYA-4575 / FGSC 10137) TaxID=498257 RepID=G2X8F5_VERDV|nr:uncharacterized protein VDAG_06096 [Verticillium dahliae VdLs.17]EGY15242.1 hypothetical protein VDAG_06096 [Verticillium dahliae VdLs.17]